MSTQKPFSLHIYPFFPSSEVSVLALMSPVHRSSSTVDAASNAAITASVLAQPECFSEGDEDLDNTGIHRSASMPPTMFDGEAHSRSSRDRAGICIQGNRGSRHRHRIIQESRSEDELTASGGAREAEDVSEKLRTDETENEGYPRGRRNAFRGRVSVSRRATCAADGAYANARKAATQDDE
jgi:hypothetical protein